MAVHRRLERRRRVGGVTLTAGFQNSDCWARSCSDEKSQERAIFSLVCAPLSFIRWVMAHSLALGRRR